MDTSELRRLFLFDHLADEQLAEIVSVSDEVAFEDGEILWREGQPAEAWWVLLDGRVELLRRSDHELSVVGVMDQPGRWAGGFLAWTESAGYLATGRGGSNGRVLRVPSDALGRLAREWFPFGVHMIEGFFSTVRGMEAMARQRAGLVALGTLAAGLAHEINNPAAAAARAAEALRETTDALLASLVTLGERSLTAEQFVALDALRRQLQPSSALTDPLAVADREEELLDWLEQHGVDDAWRFAPALAAAGATIEWCEQSSEVLTEATLSPGLEWVASTAAMSALLTEISESTRRVSGLVEGVKSYSQLDRASLQEVDVTEGLDSTLLVLGSKLRNGITVKRDYAPDLPKIAAHPSELNQVWTNLIDNAVDAMDGEGTLRLSTRADDTHVIVEVTDTGPGMPPDVQRRAFEPFFTTKDVGHGTGLGLDISRRIIVDRHHGDIAIESTPGRTVITVRLPRTAA